MKNIPVEGFSDLERDPNTGAILSKNSIEYEKYLKIKNKRTADSAKLDVAMNEIYMLKLELKEIKDLLLNLGKQNGTV